MKDLLPKYFSSQWSFAQIRGPDVQCQVAFGPEGNSVYGTIVYVDDSLHLATYYAFACPSYLLGWRVL